MSIGLFALALIVGVFAMGAILGAPYLPTRKATAKAALKLLGLKRGDTVVDLGSGGGGFLLLAAKHGIRGVGYEINPLLFLLSRLRTRKFRDLVTIKLADYWHHELPPADGIYVFLIKRYMERLDNKLAEEITKPTPVVSFAFQIPNKKFVRQVGELYLYRYS
ncbi:hypothetical protein HY441_00920 [Candidatus Microgenomates bacterium]|nr:hypothetical protein [Candidatus Microgenomates bacterium]